MTTLKKEESVYISRLERLARHLDVAIFYVKHREFYGRGLFICSPNSTSFEDADWQVTDVQRNKILASKKPVILVTHDMLCLDHEIGHHITDTAYWDGFGDQESLEGTTLLAAFTRNGLKARLNDRSEVMAESLGQYLRGAKLNQILLRACERVLNEMPKPQARRIRKFRERSLAARAKEEMRKAA
jgi:hypothetical protein